MDQWHQVGNAVEQGKVRTWTEKRSSGVDKIGRDQKNGVAKSLRGEYGMKITLAVSIFKMLKYKHIRPTNQ